MFTVDLFGQKLNGVLVWDIFDHESGSLVCLDWVNVDDEIVGIVVTSLVVIHGIGLLVDLRVVGRVLVVGGRTWLIFLSLRRFTPHLSALPLLFFYTLRFRLLNLIPNAANTFQLNRFQNDIWCLPEHIWWMHNSSDIFVIWLFFTHCLRFSQREFYLTLVSYLKVLWPSRRSAWWRP